MPELVLPDITLNNIKMVIFDKDGTLIDVHYYWCSMIMYRAEFFLKELKDETIDKEKLYDELVENMGIDLETQKMKPEGPVGIKPRKYIIDVAHNTIQQYTDNVTKENVEDVFNAVDVYSTDRLKDIVKPLDGVCEILENLKNCNIKISIATTDLTSRTILAMEHLGLARYFIDIAGADLVTNAKPSPDLVKYLVNKNNLTINDVVVIGDSMADLKMSKNAKCRFIGVKSGLYNDLFLRESGILINSLNDISIYCEGG